MNKLLIDYLKYNLWAQQRLCTFLSNYDEELIEQKMISSFPSIRLTLLHIWDAEIIWFKRLQDESINHFPSRDFSGSVADIYQGLLANSEAFYHYVKEAGAAYLVENCVYTNTLGEEFRQQVGEIIQHTLNHSSFHRGQVITLCRQLGMTDIVSTDYIVYLREQS